MHKSGVINLQDDIIHLPTVLFDSGAIQSNYIDEEFVKHNIVYLDKFIQQFDHSVKLGDNNVTIGVSMVYI